MLFFEKLFRRKRSKQEEAKKFLRAVLVGVAAVLFWRGMWGLMDLYFFTGNETVSFIFSIVLGVGILYFTKNLFKEFLGE